MLLHKDKISQIYIHFYNNIYILVKVIGLINTSDIPLRIHSSI